MLATPGATAYPDLPKMASVNDLLTIGQGSALQIFMDRPIGRGHADLLEILAASILVGIAATEAFVATVQIQMKSMAINPRI
jgi:hypothetical protein